MENSKIAWTNNTWNIIKGCTKISIGCENCYALRMLKHDGDYREGEILFLRDRISLPLKWKDPKLIFVNSMSDLFHKDVKLEHLNIIFDVMKQNKRHIFQILTKRPSIARVRLEQLVIPDNVWIGVTVEHESTVDRIKVLRGIEGARNKFISFEPLLSDICDRELDLSGIGWVIVGGEKVPTREGKARPMYDGWAMRIYEKCKREGIPFFFKQYGSNRPSDCSNDFDKIQQFPREFDRIIRKNEQLNLL